MNGRSEQCNNAIQNKIACEIGGAISMMPCSSNVCKRVFALLKSKFKKQSSRHGLVQVGSGETTFRVLGLPKSRAFHSCS
eukprot:3517254-Amphidinium_carterae.1